MRVMADTEFIRFFVIVEMTFTNYAIASSGLSVLHNNRHIAFSQSLSLFHLLGYDANTRSRAQATAEKKMVRTNLFQCF